MPTKTKKSDQLPVFSAGGMRMATIRGRVFEKSVDGSKHFLRVPPSIAMDAPVFDSYRDQFDSIEIFDREKGDAWTITLADFDAHKTEIERGFGPQYSVLFAYWSKNGAEPVGVCQVGASATIGTGKRAAPTQQTLSLYD